MGFEMELLNDSLKALCNTFAEIHESSLSSSEREDYEKRKRYYEKRFLMNKNRMEEIYAESAHK